MKGKQGLVPNMTRTMANAPAASDGDLQVGGAPGMGILPAKVREQIASAVSLVNRCDDCVAAHSAVGRMVGLTAGQIVDSRFGTSVDPKADALIRFVREVVDARGRVGGGDLDDVREAGFDDPAMAEGFAIVALMTFDNDFNRMPGLELPKARS